MGTRSGDLDPTVVTFLMEKEGWSTAETNNFLNKNVAFLVIRVSSDFRDLESAADEGNKRAQLALDRFAYGVKKYIGAYAAVLNGVDVVVFTAGLGENSASMRAKICEGLNYLGIEIDAKRNNIRGEEALISSDASKTKVLVIPTNEELMIARDTYEIVNKKK